jgi:hypothetical protein
MDFENVGETFRQQVGPWPVPSPTDGICAQTMQQWWGIVGFELPAKTFYNSKTRDTWRGFIS